MKWMDKCDFILKNVSLGVSLLNYLNLVALGKQVNEGMRNR